jgi:hypothetical protein
VKVSSFVFDGRLSPAVHAQACLQQKLASSHVTWFYVLAGMIGVAKF